ncbi:MAG: hypothetical protein UT86_C0001G0012 [Candidatus Magasanikbacteria bacterium GW2011_GWC2_40_17]|uniref:Amine oxidase domain-containing protein n=1 Tax=Candidatus Magasanikbacteria bacterium GW2011_GWA2_42_32 TaxID=1619039 RepID=A0A0G1A8J2_9BACT|nr:MAG: hypothetical protein UT86_C0001G0012 [Candidatus Magasanikbacteria bacterium GW2011_GWC2_40_17]KKS57372.1 MAG: hypothetical protein UV20_C0001G0012 [Candidatus Magasanikbacteria bacterium GW2011_GWA2_42_32]
MSKKIIIIGAGPSGLAAGWELARHKQEVLILEKEKEVGGLCRTFDFQGYKFDFGGHRFFSKQQEIRDFWRQILNEDFLIRKRLSRIYYRRKFFLYPIKLGDALKKLGLKESLLTGLSFVAIRLKRIFLKKEEINFEDWVVNRFGWRLFNHFFKSYTEKVWGISVRELGADWAAQRMKDISLGQILKSFIIKPQKGQVKSWIEEFHYPKYGPGMLYNKIAEEIKKDGGKIEFESSLVKIKHSNGQVDKIIIKKGEEMEEFFADEFVSSVPLPLLLKSLNPAPPDEILKIIDKMRFRAFFDVCLIVNKKEIFPDNWIYIHEPDVSVLRVQNFKNWSPFLAADKTKTNIGAEYICWETDQLWNMNEEELVKLATDELIKIGLLEPGSVEAGMVIRNRFAYPVYHIDYKKDLEVIFKYLSNFKNLQTIGRSGLYRYNNMDHSILTGFYAARNILEGKKYNILEINSDAEYHEVERKN